MIINKHVKDMIDSLSEKEKDAVYRYLWSRYVREDIVSYAEAEEMTVTKERVDYAVKGMVEYGDYDCNLSYWENIHNLLA